MNNQNFHHVKDEPSFNTKIEMEESEDDEVDEENAIKDNKNKSFNEEEENENQIAHFDDEEYEKIKNDIADLEKIKLEGDAEYIGQLEEYFNVVKEEHASVKEMENKAKKQMLEIRLHKEKLTEELQFFYE